MGDRGSVPFGWVTVAFGIMSLLALALALGFDLRDGRVGWWVLVAWTSGLFAFVGGLATVGTRWIGDPWWPSQRLGALGAGLAATSGLIAFGALVMQPTSSY